MWLKPKDVMSMALKLYRSQLVAAVHAGGKVNNNQLINELAKEMANHLDAVGTLDAMRRPLSPISLRRCKQIAELFLGEFLVRVKDRILVTAPFIADTAIKDLRNYSGCNADGILNGEAALLYEMQSEYFSTVLNDRREILQNLLSEIEITYQTKNSAKSCSSFLNFLFKLIDGTRNPVQVDKVEYCSNFNVLNDIEFDAVCTLLETVIKLGNLSIQQFNDIDCAELQQDRKFLTEISGAFNHVSSLVQPHELPDGEKLVGIYATDFGKDSRIFFKVTSTKNIGDASCAVLSCKFVLRKQNRISTSEWMDISTFVTKHKTLLSNIGNYEFDENGAVIKF